MDLKEWKLVASGDFSRRHPWEIARLWTVFGLLDRNGFHADSRFTILDFGAGDLFVAMGIKSKFQHANIVSIDSAYSDETILALRGKAEFSSISCHKSMKTWTVGAKDKADVVLLLDVLEHCEDDSEVVQTIRGSNKIVDKALWIVTVPAFSGLFTKHDTFLGHHRRYRYWDLADALHIGGLEIQTGGYFFSVLLLPRLLVKCFEALGFGKSKQPKGLAGFRPPKFFGKLIAMFLYADFKLVTLLNDRGIRFPGLSCYALARNMSAQPAVALAHKKKTAGTRGA